MLVEQVVYASMHEHAAVYARHVGVPYMQVGMGVLAVYATHVGVHLPCKHVVLSSVD